MFITESGLLKISAIGTLASLVVLYFLSSSLQVQSMAIRKLDHSFVGQFVNITGEVKNLKKSDTGISFNLIAEEKKIKVVLWSDVIESLSLKGFDIESIKDGARINVIGVLENYKGSIQVVPTRPEIRVV